MLHEPLPLQVYLLCASGPPPQLYQEHMTEGASNSTWVWNS